MICFNCTTCQRIWGRTPGKRTFTIVQGSAQPRATVTCPECEITEAQKQRQIWRSHAAQAPRQQEKFSPERYLEPVIDDVLHYPDLKLA